MSAALAPPVYDCDPMTVDSPIDLTIDFDRTHMTVTQEPPVPPVGTDDVDDVMLTSAGPPPVSTKTETMMSC